MKPRLIILSDLWGKQKSAWIQFYIEKLSPVFNIQYYDCCELGKIETSTYTQEHLHQQFVSFGIENAVKQLLQLEKNSIHVLSFSIGGIIAWKAALLGLPLLSLNTISATRLRHETSILKIPVQLYFGMNDAHKPSDNWCNQFSSENITHFDDESHEMYRKEKIAVLVCKKIIEAN
ncbi:alpha/beta hydrolase [Kordia sp.]|uniref:alpha/beta hydrolase n=1 Tax=Kordia sp. TaxID=1965332 RepID=UPI003D2E3015